MVENEIKLLKRVYRIGMPGGPQRVLKARKYNQITGYPES